MKKELLINELNVLAMELKSCRGIDLIGEDENLKLYEIANILENEEDNNEFNIFCELSCDEFKEKLYNNSCKLDCVGRTSTFYINHEDMDIFYFEYKQLFNQNKIKNLLNVFVYNFIDYNIEVEFNEKNEVIDLAWYDEDDYTLTSIDKEVMEFKENLLNIIDTYQYIQEFKENQVQIWNEFRENN